MEPECDGCQAGPMGGIPKAVAYHAGASSRFPSERATSGKYGEISCRLDVRPYPENQEGDLFEAGNCDDCNDVRLTDMMREAGANVVSCDCVSSILAILYAFRTFTFRMNRALNIAMKSLIIYIIVLRKSNVK